MKAPAVLAILLFSTAVSFSQNIAGWGGDSLPGLGSPSDRVFPADPGRITGTVVTIDGRPQPDVQVEVYDFATHRVVSAVYTNQSGGFIFSMVPSGNYELIATHGTDSIRANVTVSGSFEIVNLRLDRRDSNASSSHNGMVSLSELKVPQRARDAYAKAEQAALKGRPEDVLKHLQRALVIYPNYAPALTLRAALSLDKNEVEVAVSDLDEAIHSDSTYAMAYAVMASALNRMNKFDEALRAAERAASLSPNSWQPYFEMAKSYLAKTDYEHALQQLTHAQTAAQDYALLHLLRAKALIGLGNYNDAVNELKTFLKIAPNDPSAASARDALGQINAFTAARTELAKDEQRRPEQ